MDRFEIKLKNILPDFVTNCKDYDVKIDDTGCSDQVCNFDKRKGIIVIEVPEGCEDKCVTLLAFCKNSCAGCDSVRFKVCPCTVKEDCGPCEECHPLGYCVSICDDDQVCLKDGKTCGDCDENNPCPDGEICVDGNCICPPGFIRDKFGDCVKDCPEGSRYNALTKKCDPIDCPEGVWHPKKKICVECLDKGDCSDPNACCDENNNCKCCDGYYFNIMTGFCEKIPDCEGDDCCPDGYYWDYQLKQCVEEQCPPGYVWVKDLGCMPECDCDNPYCGTNDACVDRGDGVCYCQSCNVNCANGCPEGCFCPEGEDVCKVDPCRGKCDGNCPEECGCLDDECVNCQKLGCGDECSRALGCHCPDGKCETNDDPCSKYSCDDNCGDRPDCHCPDGNCVTKEDCETEFTVEKIDGEDGNCRLQVKFGSNQCCPCPEIVVNNRLRKIEEVGENYLKFDGRFDIMKAVANGYSTNQDAGTNVLPFINDTSNERVFQDDDLTFGDFSVSVVYSVRDRFYDEEEEEYYFGPIYRQSPIILIDSLSVASYDMVDHNYQINKPGTILNDKKYESAEITYYVENVGNSDTNCFYDKRTVGKYFVGQTGIQEMINLVKIDNTNYWINKGLKSDDCKYPGLRWYRAPFEEGIGMQQFYDNPLRKLHIKPDAQGIYRDYINKPDDNPEYNEAGGVDNLGDGWSGYGYMWKVDCPCVGEKNIHYYENCESPGRLVFCNPLDEELVVRYEDCGKKIIIERDFDVSCVWNQNLNNIDFGGTADQKEKAQVKYEVYINGDLVDTITPKEGGTVLRENQYYVSEDIIQTFEVKINHDECEECDIIREYDGELPEIPPYEIDCSSSKTRRITFNPKRPVVIEPQGIILSNQSGVIFDGISESIDVITFKFTFLDLGCERFEELDIPFIDCCQDVSINVTSSVCGDDLAKLNYSISKGISGGVIRILRSDVVIHEESIGQKRDGVFDFDNQKARFLSYEFISDGNCVQEGTFVIDNGVDRVIGVSTDSDLTYCQAPSGNDRPFIEFSNIEDGDVITLNLSDVTGSRNVVVSDPINGYRLDLLRDTVVTIDSVSGNSNCGISFEDDSLEFKVSQNVVFSNFEVIGECIDNVTFRHNSSIDVEYSIDVYQGSIDNFIVNVNGLFTNRDEVVDFTDYPNVVAGQVLFIAKYDNGCQSYETDVEGADLSSCGSIEPRSYECNDQLMAKYEFGIIGDHTAPVISDLSGNNVSYTSLAPDGDYAVYETEYTTQTIYISTTSGSNQINDSLSYNCECQYESGSITVVRSSDNLNGSYNYSQTGYAPVFNVDMRTVDDSLDFTLNSPVPGNFRWVVNGVEFTDQSITVDNNGTNNDGVVELYINQGICEQVYTFNYQNTACDNSGSVQVDYNEVDVVLCENESALLSVNVTGSNGLVEWIKDGLDVVGTGTTYNVSEAGSYEVRITDGDCVYTFDGLVEVSVVDIPEAVLTQTCDGDNVILSIDNVSDYDASSTWSYNGNQLDINQSFVIPENTSSVLSFDLEKDGCGLVYQSTVQLNNCCDNVSPLLIDGECSGVLSVNSNTSIDASSVQWRVDGDLVGNGLTYDFSTYNAVPNQIYTIAVDANAVGGCSFNTATRVCSLGCSSSVSLIQSGVDCSAFVQANVSGFSNPSYEWTVNGSVIQSVTGNVLDYNNLIQYISGQSLNISVSVTDANGCSGNDTVNVVVCCKGAGLSISGPSNNILTANVSTSEPVTYQWFVDGQANVSGNQFDLSSLPAGNQSYTITVQAVYGQGGICNESASYQYDSNCPTGVNISYSGFSSVVCEGSSVSVSASVSGIASNGIFTWYKNGSQVQSSTSPVYNFTIDSDSSIYVKYEVSGCSYNGDVVNIDVISVPDPVFEISECSNSGNRTLSLVNFSDYSGWSITTDQGTFVDQGQMLIGFGNVTVSINSMTVSEVVGGGGGLNGITVSCTRTDFNDYTFVVESCCGAVVTLNDNSNSCGLVDRSLVGFGSGFVSWNWILDNVSVSSGLSQIQDVPLFDKSTITDGAIHTLRLEVTESGCSYSDEITFVACGCLCVDGNCNQISISLGYSSCRTSIVATINGTGGQEYDYEWSTGSTDSDNDSQLFLATDTLNDGQSVSLTVSLDGCSVTESIVYEECDCCLNNDCYSPTVNVATLNAPSNQNSCADTNSQAFQAFVGGLPANTNYTYQWSITENGVYVSGNPSPVPFNSNNGDPVFNFTGLDVNTEYLVSVIISIDGCDTIAGQLTFICQGGNT